MSWLLDADVLSQPAKRLGDPAVAAWLEREKDKCYTSAVVIAQLAYWVRTEDDRAREALQAWLTKRVDSLHGKIHGFNVSIAHNLTIVTGNDKDFRRPGLKVFNPFKEL